MPRWSPGRIYEFPQWRAVTNVANADRRKGAVAKLELQRLQNKIAAMYSLRVAVIDRQRGVFECDLDDEGNKLTIPLAVIPYNKLVINADSDSPGVVISISLTVQADKLRRVGSDGQTG